MSATKFKLKSARRRPYSERTIHNGFNIFVDSNATALVDEFFNKHEIWKLDFKCSTWTRMKNAATKINVAAMHEFFGSDVEINFSHKAGCSCGCSPGYRARKAFGQAYHKYINQDIWAEVKADLSELKAKMPKFEEMLKKELATKNSK